MMLGVWSMFVGRNVRALRRLNDMTQAELAQAMSDLLLPIDSQAIGFLERGDRKVSVDELATMAMVFQVDVNTLLTQDNLLAALQGSTGSPPQVDIALLMAEYTDE